MDGARRITLLLYYCFIALLLHYCITLLLYYFTTLFNRFAHSAGPGMGPQRVEVVGSGFDGLMRSSK